MKQQLLAGVAALALVAAASSALAQPNTANDNSGVQAVTQDNSTDVVAAGSVAVENGAYTTNGNALGENQDDIAAAHKDSFATQVSVQDGEAAATNKSLASEDGAVAGSGIALGDDPDDNAVVGGNGVALNSENDNIADDGSVVLVGDKNEAAAAEEDSVAANAGSTAVRTNQSVAENGAAFVSGDGNNTAAAENGAAVGVNGTAVGIDNINIGSNDATLAFGEGNVVAGAHLEEVNSVSTQIGIPGIGGVGVAAEGEGGEISVGGEQGEGIFIGGIFAKVGGVVAYGPHASITTGDIHSHEVGSLTGANMLAANTGLANQGDAIGVAASSSF